jgi:8-oxo-dGTP pyrophosphatase MutT (NUDIX family)
MKNKIKVVNSIIFNDTAKDKILFCKKGDFWILPGGKIEANEDEFVALQRELDEELRIKNFKIVLDTKKIFFNLKTISGKAIKEIICYEIIIFDTPKAYNEIKYSEYFSKKESLEMNLSSATKNIIESIEF